MPLIHDFQVGITYNRVRDIHNRYGGQQRGGIATPAKFPLIFVFTGPSGAAHGYQDTFQPDGVFWFCGEGQDGDMQVVRGNAALRDQLRDKKTILVFQSTPDDQVRFLGEADCIGQHFDQRPDTHGALRAAIIFHLAFVTQASGDAVNKQNAPEYHPISVSARLSLAELRRIALARVDRTAAVEERLRDVWARSEAIRLYALKRAKGICEACAAPAPFRSSRGPYLEVHHATRLSDGGPDHPRNVIAVCPNCHRRAHYSDDAQAFNAQLVAWLANHEPE